MLIILLSWIYIIFTSINFGLVTDSVFRLRNKNFAVTAFLGLFSITILASIWAFFGRINSEFHIILLLTNILIFYNYRSLLAASYKSLCTSIVALSNGLKILLSIYLFLLIAQSSTAPYVIDNESYYIQTIKWFNEYGFVKGLANLHLYLGQASGWHVTQSVFNFSFLYPNLNDLSGFCLLLGLLFSIEKLEEFHKNSEINYLLMGAFPLASVYFFQFISAPSPDIPIYVLTFVVLFYFLENFKNCPPEKFNLIVILVLFMLYIKSTSIVFAFLPVVLLFQNFKILSKKLVIPSLISILILVLFISKNMMVSGSIFFPSKFLASLSIDYSIPKIIESNYYNLITYFGYQLTPTQYEAMAAHELVLHWISLPKINGLFNKLSLLILFISPFFIFKFYNKKSLWVLYIFMVLQLILLLSTSPQYRFFMNFTIFFGLFCLICLFRKRNLILLLHFAGAVPVAFLLYFTVSFSALTNNKFMTENSTFSLKMLVKPEPNTKIKTNFEVIELGNLKYNSPLENEFFYGTSDGLLPCVNKVQIEYFRKNYGYIPQMRTTDLKDGFYSKKIAADE